MTSRSFAGAAMLAASISGASAGCKCKYQDHVLPEELYTDYPLQNPGEHKDDVADGRYGTMCAAWDAMPGTPYFDSCTGDKLADNGWCTAPWCYVEGDCPDAEPTVFFNGSSTTMYSYSVCGAPDCFTTNADGSPVEGCPYGSVHAASCACKFAGEELPKDLLEDYPEDDEGKYKDLRGIEYYGTACGAWDQQPDTPFFTLCPADSDWCDSAFNWCQAPWCYVDADACDKMNEVSSIFNGTIKLHYSYETCGAVNCQAQQSDDCPWDGSSIPWYTAVDCGSSDGSDGSEEDSKAASALALFSAITAPVIMTLTGSSQ